MPTESNTSGSKITGNHASPASVSPRPKSSAPHQHQSEADKKMKPDRAELRERQHLQREDDFFHEVGIGHHHRRSQRHRLCRQVKNDQAAKHREHEVRLRLIGQHLETAAENHAKHDVVNQQHEQRVEHCPEDAEVTSAMAELNGPHGELPPQLALLGEVGEKGVVAGLAHACGSKNDRTDSHT